MNGSQSAPRESLSAFALPKLEVAWSARLSGGLAGLSEQIEKVVKARSGFDEIEGRIAELQVSAKGLRDRIVEFDGATEAARVMGLEAAPQEAESAICAARADLTAVEREIRCLTMAKASAPGLFNPLLDDLQRREFIVREQLAADLDAVNQFADDVCSMAETIKDEARLLARVVSLDAPTGLKMPAHLALFDATLARAMDEIRTALKQARSEGRSLVKKPQPVKSELQESVREIQIAAFPRAASSKGGG